MDYWCTFHSYGGRAGGDSNINNSSGGSSFAGSVLSSAAAVTAAATASTLSVTWEYPRGLEDELGWEISIGKMMCHCHCAIDTCVLLVCTRVSQGCRRSVRVGSVYREEQLLS
jgi:hypothetical protein